MPELSQFQKDYQALVRLMTDNVFQLIEAGRNKEEIILILSRTDFKKTILSNPEFSRSLNNLDGLYVKALKDIEQFADITPSTLKALAQVNKATFINKLADDIAFAVKGNLTSGILGGLEKDAIISSITADLRPDQVETLVTTALSTYTASVNVLMADKLPKNTAYIYRGPIDKKTRDVCLRFAASGELTRKEIEDILPGAFLDRGGYNCRHQWVPAVKDQALYFPKEAKVLAQDKGLSIG